MSLVAERYALALFEVAQKHGSSLDIEHDLREVKKVFEMTPELYNLIVSPKLSAEKINLEFSNGINPYKIKKGRKASLIYTNHLKPIIFN